MSLGGFTNFAKNALLTAQKHIDSALHIEEEVEDEEAEDDEETEHEDNIANGEDSASLYESAVLSLSQHREHKLSEKHGQERKDVDLLEDVDLYGPSPPQSQWGEESSSKNNEVVDTEPNPIRDAHEPTNIYHFSPSSHSPDDDERSSQNGQSSSNTAHGPIHSEAELEGSLVNLEKAKEHGDDLDEHLLVEGAGSIVRGASERTLDRFEEVRTIASSDIEVIRQMDDWSITSSQNHNGDRGQAKFPGVNLKEVLKPEALITTTTGLVRKPSDPATQPELLEQIALLMAKLKHRDQRLEELGRLNENLKATNTNLSSKNKQKTLTETKLQAQLVEKEKQLNDLMEEGKKLSEYSGRQAKEIRKLKQQLTQLEVVTAARDSAMEELQEAHQQIQEQEAQIEELKTEGEKAEKRADQLNGELEKLQGTSGGLEKQLCEQLTQLERANAELKRLEKEAKLAAKERENLLKENRQLSAKLLSKTAQERVGDERERGLLEDLNIERAKATAASARVRELEQRIEGMQDAQRDIALDISNANSPLLATIAGLEEKLFSLERQNEQMASQLRQANERVAEANGKFESEVEILRRSLEEERQNSAQRMEELGRMGRSRDELQSRLKQVEEEAAAAEKMRSGRMERLEQQLEELEAELRGKRTEMAELERKNRELKQKAALARKEQQQTGGGGGALFQQPIGQPIKVGSPESVRAEFQQQREALIRAQKAQQQPGLKFSSTSSPTPSQARVDLGMPRDGSDYSLDFASSDHLRAELESAQAQLFQLHERFDHLLELYGGCLESIEEVKEDNEDLRKLCKEQAIKIAEMQNQDGAGQAGEEED